ncbi:MULTISPECIES: lytic transglycosylase domain-containing protein [Clostridium]|uniref:Soluble lytic murein transglycosylase n=1 Tax=Clostridium ragsdalei P11 TaxID=1353534 RepID=A0A1A6AQS9_9CLOT|nr:MULTISPECIES: lytic transglycosylase domain-containing protein [Clostridium]OBR92424.1 soluble lytic murein transglycosylase precursor [Clostridium ragsdalei P11]
MRFLKKVAIVIILIMVAVLCVKSIARYCYPLKYSTYIAKYAKQYDLDPYFVMAVIKTESNFKENVRSNKNAIGLMQITPDTAEWAADKMGVSNFQDNMLNDPEFNIRMGCWYLNNLKSDFDNNMDLILAAYNGGRGNVKKWLKDSDHSKDGKNIQYIPFKETDKYIKRVKVNYRVYKYLYKNLQINTSVIIVSFL